MKRWDYSDISSGGHKKIKGPTHMVEGTHHLSKAPPTHNNHNKTKHANTSTCSMQYIVSRFYRNSR